MATSKTKQQLLLEIEDLRARLGEAEETLRAIRSGKVDALVVSGPQGDQIYTLQDADRIYRILMETMEEGTATLAKDGTILYCNRRLAAMLKMPLEKVIGSSIENYLSSEDWQALQRPVKDGKSSTHRGEFRLQIAGGDRMPVLFSSASLEIGNEPGICLTAADLTVQMRAEEEIRKAHDELEIRVQERTAELERTNKSLRKSQALLRAVMENTSDPVYIKDRQNRILMCNPALEKVVGKPASGIVGKSAGEYFNDPVIGQALHEHDLSVMESGQSQAWEETVKTPDGYRIFISNKAPYRNELGEIIGILGISHDITERKKAEQALRESEAKSNALVKYAPTGIYELDYRTGRFLSVNDAMCQILGYTREELFVMGAMLLLDEKSRELFASRIKRQLAGEKIEESVEYRVRKKDGSVIDAILNVSFNPAGGDPNRALVVAYDITERKRGEEALRESEQRFRQLAAASFEGIGISDGGVVIDANAQLAAMLGCDLDELIGRPVSDFIVPESLGLVMDHINSGSTEAYEHLSRRKDGSIFPTEAQGRTIPWKGRMARVTALRDITERKRAEEELRKAFNQMEIKVQERTADLVRANQELQGEMARRERAEAQMRQAQKLESIGTLTGGIAHDFNNILQTIGINADLALFDLPGGSSVRNNLDLIRQSALRGKDLVSQMLLFSRKSAKKPAVMTLTPLIKETFKLLRSSIPATIQMNLHLKTELDAVYADPSQVQQVIMNLCTNAAYAMRGTTGSINLSLRDITFGSEDLPEGDMHPGDYLMLSVEDSGCGMDEEVRKRIFEPFFTTKPAGEGTGLGLSVAYGIVKSHRGSITVYSEPGKGTIFKVCLPKAGTGVSAKVKTLEPIPRGNERILFVDDEEIIVHSVRNMLEHLGYQVTALMDSQEALNLFSANPSQFDLVITDQTMPFMTGEDLGRELMRIRSDIPVILCTGYSDLVSSEEAMKKGFRDFIMKPFTVREGAELVRRVLDPKRSK